MLSSCSLIDKIVNTDPPSDPTEDTTPGSDTMPDDGDTTEPDDTTDTTEPDDTTDDGEDTTDTAIEDNVFFATDMYTVTEMNGLYVFHNDYDLITRAFVDAFIIDGKLFLISEGNGMYALHTVNEHGKLQSRMNSNCFENFGDHIWTNGILYDSDLVENYSLQTPWYVGGLYTALSDAKYDDENDILYVSSLHDGVEFRHTIYLGLDTDMELPEGAVLIGEKRTDSDKSRLYSADDGYYFTYDYLTVKVPVEGKFDDISMLTDEMVRFIRVADGEMESVEAEYHFRKTSTGKYYVAFSTITSNITDAIEIMPNHYKHEYSGAQILLLEPKTYVVKDGEIVHKFDFFRVSFDEIGEFLAIGDPPYDPYIVLKPDLTLFSEATFDDFLELGDGNYHAIYAGSGKSVILDADGGIIYESPDDIVVWNIGTAVKRIEDGTIVRLGDWALAKFADGTLRMLTPYGEELCNFGEIGDNIYYHWMISGYYEKEGYPYGLYFIIEDNDDRNERGISRNYEYYYSFETGEHGIIDNGYQEMGAYAKPVLYLYPTEKTDVTVTFEHPERLIVDYPKYDNGWRVTSMPDGTLTDKNGREYYALYWEESSTTPTYDFVDGFCVSGEDSAIFLEEKLSELGFTDKEANEFIIYWLPILEANEYNLIRFELTDEREASSALHISPAPDSLLRVAMHIKALDTPVQIREQTLPTFERIGFVAVEWGGCIH